MHKDCDFRHSLFLCVLHTLAKDLYGSAIEIRGAYPLVSRKRTPAPVVGLAAGD